MNYRKKKNFRPVDIRTYFLLLVEVETNVAVK
jgi:hypothetical protein